MPTSASVPAQSLSENCGVTQAATLLPDKNIAHQRVAAFPFFEQIGLLHEAVLRKILQGLNQAVFNLSNSQVEITGNRRDSIHCRRLGTAHQARFLTSEQIQSTNAQHESRQKQEQPGCDKFESGHYKTSCKL